MIDINKTICENDSPDLLFTGDFFVNRTGKSNTMVENNPQISCDIKDIIQRADISVTNFEGPIDIDAEKISKSGPNLRMDSFTPEFLKSNEFDMVSLANNHIMDYGKNGLVKTMEDLASEDIRFVGAGTNEKKAFQPLEYVSDSGEEIGILSLTEQEFGIASASSPGAAWISSNKLYPEIVSFVNNFDITIIISHGGLEYLPIPPQQRREQLRCFADLGIDLIIGHHPHVPQGWEIYDETPIFYSLGDFIFTQNNHDSRWGIVTLVEIDGPNISSVKILPITYDNNRVRIINDFDEKIDYLYKSSQIICDELDYMSHWQELAVQRLITYYSRHINKACSGSVLRQMRYPITRRHIWDEDRRSDHMLWLLNVMRNESHRDLIETAISVKTRHQPDYRDSTSESNIKNLLDITDVLDHKYLRRHL